MEDNLNFSENGRRPHYFTKMEDDLNFFSEMEDYLGLYKLRMWWIMSGFLVKTEAEYVITFLWSNIQIK